MDFLIYPGEKTLVDLGIEILFKALET